MTSSPVMEPPPVAQPVRVSVIVAAYNAASFLHRALNSVIAQTETRWELIVVDDMSTDETPALIASYAARDSRVIPMHVERNGGPGFARNQGLRRACGEWIALLDSDDAFLPDRLATLLALGESTGADMIADNLLLRNGATGAITGRMFPDDRFNGAPLLMSPAAFVTGNLGNAQRLRLAYGFMKPMIRTSFLRRHELSYRVSRFAEDYVFYLDLLAHGARWLVTPDAHYEYDVRLGSLSVTVDPADAFAAMAAERDVLALPGVQGDAALREAIRVHQRSTELSTAWVHFAEALKERRPIAALSTMLADRETAFHIARELRVHVARALASRFVRRRYARGLAAPADAP